MCEVDGSINKAVSLYKRNGFMLLKGVKKSPGHDLAFEKKLAPSKEDESAMKL